MILEIDSVGFQKPEVFFRASEEVDGRAKSQGHI